MLDKVLLHILPLLHQKTWWHGIFMLFSPYSTLCVGFFNYFALYNVGWKIVQPGGSEWQGQS